MDDFFYRDIIDSLSDGVYFTDTERRITFWNRGAEKLTGYSRDEVLGKRCMDNILMHVSGSGHLLCTSSCPLSATLGDRKPRECEVFFHHKDGHRVPVLVRTTLILGNDNSVVGAVEVFSSTLSKARLAERLVSMERMALLDSLTELPNRRFLERQVSARLGDLSRHGIGFGVLFADIDRFKTINDTLGHETGDLVLKMVARTLDGSSRHADVVGRWGGEEFLGIIGNTRPGILEEVGERFRALVARCNLDRRPDLRVTISVGGTYALPDDTVASLIDRADRMLYSAKSQGRDRVCVTGP